jgi:hypothetical protein
MKQEFESDKVTAFSSHRNDQQSNWRRKEDGYPFLYNCYNCGMKEHKRSNCRKPAKYNGNYCGDHHIGNNYGGHVSTEVNMTERSSNQDGKLETEVLIIWKRPQVKKGQPIYIQLLLNYQG